MKKIISILTLLVCVIYNVNAQCSEAKNNFEMQLEQIGQQQLSVKIRCVSNNASVQNNLWATNLKLDGLVFAIAYPNQTADIKITSCINTLSPFDIKIDESVALNRAKKAKDGIVTFYHNTDMPISLNAQWVSNTWYQIAIINFTGSLNKDEYFSLLDCNYGIANPNSYQGNSTTDPWLAVYDSNGNYLQFSPKMSSKIPTSISEKNDVNIYPIPTNGILNLDILFNSNSNIAIQVIDAKGAIVKTFIQELNIGINKNTIDLSNIENGVYIIKINDGKAFQYSQQIIKR